MHGILDPKAWSQLSPVHSVYLLDSVSIQQSIKTPSIRSFLHFSFVLTLFSCLDQKLKNGGHPLDPLSNPLPHFSLVVDSFNFINVQYDEVWNANFQSLCWQGDVLSLLNWPLDKNFSAWDACVIKVARGVDPKVTQLSALPWIYTPIHKGEASVKVKINDKMRSGRSLDPRHLLPSLLLNELNHLSKTSRSS